jgi:hypothetical protein
MAAAKSKNLDIHRVAATRTVNVTIPAKVAFDIDALFEVQRSIFDRLGHPACYSGADIRFILERNFIVGADGRLQG